ncbi:alpha/beta hydrolase [Cellulomonas edaphi]|uniref:Alpha/beta hydrolase n=1 Tax=Cellulomonas edaphi TaxID=3053468 RepID=A0ABT7S858_9CELL|nr:hypothetical protein [Cellulomons edaphi]MDM7831809.1 hypothetical protein [Cellulomons edaphi]
MHIDVTPRTGVLALAAALALAGCAGTGSPASTASAGQTMAAAKAPGCLPSGTQAVTVDSGGTTTAVAVAGGGAHGVVLAPQNGGDWCQWADEAAHLVEEGYRVATFTWPGSGARAGQAAMRSAAEALRTAGAQDVALVGASKGGTYAVAMADELAAVGVVALSPPSRFDGLDARSSVVPYRGPLLVMASRDDPDVPRDDSYLVARPSEGPSFLEIPLAAHGVAMLQDEEHREHVTFEIDDQLARSFGG